MVTTRDFEALGVFQEVHKDLTKDQNYFEKEIHVEILWTWKKTWVLYNKTRTQWTTWVAKDTLSFGEGGNKRNHVYGNLFVLCSKWNHPGNLEIEHVSPIVAFVCNHMLLWLWLSQLHWEDPCIGLQVYWKWGNYEPYIGAWSQLALCIGRTSMERRCHILNLPVLHIGEYLSSGHWWQQDEIVSCG